MRHADESYHSDFKPQSKGLNLCPKPLEADNLGKVVFDFSFFVACATPVLLRRRGAVSL